MGDKRLSEELSVVYAAVDALSRPLDVKHWSQRAADLEDELLRSRVAVPTARNTHKEFDALLEKLRGVEAERDELLKTARECRAELEPLRRLRTACDNFIKRHKLDGKGYSDIELVMRQAQAPDRNGNR